MEIIIWVEKYKKMKKELSEDSKFELSVKTIGGMAFMIFSLVSMWFMLQADIAEAKELPIPPEPEVTKMEFKMRDEMIRQTILTTQEDVNEIKEDMKYLRDKIDKMN
mgnify:CR=1 FL=1